MAPIHPAAVGESKALAAYPELLTQHLQSNLI